MTSDEFADAVAFDHGDLCTIAVSIEKAPADGSLNTEKEIRSLSMPSESSQSAGRRKLIASHKRVTVQVTQAHIDLATPADSSHCMIADALHDALPDAKKISVDLQTIRFTEPAKGQRYTYLTPTIAQDYLVAFDQGLPLEPFQFVLHAPVQVGYAGTRQRGESRAFEGVKDTKGTSIPVKVGGEPMPMAALYSGPGRAASAVQEHLAKQNEADAVATTTTNEPQNAEPEPSITTTAPAPITTTNIASPEPEAVQPVVGNVTLTVAKGNVRRYGMRQLRARNVPRGPAQ